MTWEILIPLITSEGLKIAEAIWQFSQRSDKPTQADWDVLNQKKTELAKQRALIVLVQQGIDPTSEKGKEILALVG